MNTKYTDDTLTISFDEILVTHRCPYCQRIWPVAINPSAIHEVYGEKIEDIVWQHKCDKCGKRAWMDHTGKSGTSVYDWDDE